MVDKEKIEGNKFEEEVEEEKRPKWTDFYDLIKVFKNNKYGWMQIVLGKNKESGQFVLRLRKARQNFTIKSEKHLQVVRDLLDKGSEEYGWVSNLSDEDLNKIIEKKETLETIKDKSMKQIDKQKQTIKKLLTQVGKLREKQFSINLNDFKKEIKEFKELLKDGSKEKDIQLWLYNHPWVFGPNYIEGTKEEISRKGNRIDFLLQRYDTYYDVIELKLPTCKLFVGKVEGDAEQDISRKYQMSGEVKDTISQVIGYLESYEIDKTNLLWEKGISIHKPNGIIVIGRSEKKNRRALKSLNSYLHNVEILTYDDVVEVANNFIKLIETKNK